MLSNIVMRVVFSLLAFLSLHCDVRAQLFAESRPNIILILCDNLGYGDVGCYGSQRHRTPHVDRLAAEGLKLTSFYVSSGVCTPSRASFMTGCYSQRINMHVSDTGGLVLQPVSKKGLNPDEVTMAELLKSAGYATAIIGKWHLGDQPEFLPTRQGFDSYFGIPYSDDMTPREGKDWPPLPLMKQEQVIESGVDRNGLTRRYTQAATEFIEQHTETPFFLFLSHAMPGSTPHPYASEAFRGRSQNGPWGDSVEEIDWSTGQILSTLERLHLDPNTLLVWTSDNGAPRRNPPQGSNAPLKGWGYDTSEGAMRVPCLVRWPGHVPAGVASDLLCASFDLLPTFAKLAGVSLSDPAAIDGRDMSGVLFTPGSATAPHEAIFYYFSDQLQAVRSGPWKLYLPLARKRAGGVKRIDFSAELYNLNDDIAELRNVASAHPDIVERLTRLGEQARAELGDEGVAGSKQRAAGWSETATPRLP
jgi:arylsulfatase A-like enzyme